MNRAPKTKKLKLIPHFSSEAQERKFWEVHDSADYVEWPKAKKSCFPNLKMWLSEKAR